MRLFHLVRHEDETGISGTGVVAEGVEYTDGQVSLRWLTGTASTAVYASIADVRTIHGHGGKTEVVWLGIAVQPDDALAGQTPADPVTQVIPYGTGLPHDVTTAAVDFHGTLLRAGGERP
jgi:hypothetical protein